MGMNPVYEVAVYAICWALRGMQGTLCSPEVGIYTTFIYVDEPCSGTAVCILALSINTTSVFTLQRFQQLQNFRRIGGLLRHDVQLRHQL